MAKSSVAPKVPTRKAPQLAPITFALADVTVTYKRSTHFIGEEGDQGVTIAGVDLARVLTWMARQRPGIPRTLATVWECGAVTRGLSQALAQLSTSPEFPETGDAVWAIAHVLDDYADRMAVLDPDDAAELVKGATLTIDAPVAETAVA
jgi:hypothetical protein